MTQNDLREKVINAEAKVAKRKAVLKKHREQLAKLIQKGADEFDISIKKDDIESAKRKLEEAEKILNNWKEKLDERITAEDYNAMQAAREAHAALAEVVTSHYPDATEEAIERIAEAAGSMNISPDTMQQILDAFDKIAEAIKALGEWAAQAIRTLADFFTESLDAFLLRRAPPKWRHYALHAKRARVRKKYKDRIRRAFFASMASEGGGSS